MSNDDVFDSWRSQVQKRRDIRSALREMGFRTVMDFLAANPGESYLSIASRLGPGVTPVDVVEKQFSEAKPLGALRLAAQDALARELNRFAKRGWGRGSNAKFNVSAAYAFWLNDLKFQGGSPELAPVAYRVWNALVSSSPPDDWRPSGPHDQVIESAFAVGWPKASNGD